MSEWRNGYPRKQMDSTIRVQIQNGAVQASHFAIAFGQCLNPFFHSLSCEKKKQFVSKSEECCSFNIINKSLA